DRKAATPHLSGELADLVDILKHLGLGDVEDEPQALAALRPVAADDVGNREALQTGDAHIDRETHVDADLTEIDAGLERADERALGQPDDARRRGVLDQL